ncbi:kinase-like domain-containing protein [Phellopilus nigrolimitatus]|nr:kinase-like domain-containing protein [Phellopilus nigrolimitatus]KAH8109800.1 kinase-like domain-containing protein [Phellopilus nigrolimitatus]
MKAANVLISPDGCPLLMDFGLSHLLLSTSTLETATDATRGSIRWMAPELLGTTKVAEAGDDDKVHTKQSDIWAFGMTALELLTKQVPYSNIRVDPGIIRAMLEKTIPCNPEGLDDWKVIDKKLWEFCKMCWVFNPVERPDMNQLSDELKRIREESKDNLKVVVQAF